MKVLAALTLLGLVAGALATYGSYYYPSSYQNYRYPYSRHYGDYGYPVSYSLPYAKKYVSPVSYGSYPISYGSYGRYGYDYGHLGGHYEHPHDYYYYKK